MPQDYQNKISQFDATTRYTTQQHVNKMTYYFELHEIDDFDVQMRLFSRKLTGEVKKRVKGLNPGSIVDLVVFHRLFFNKWEKKKNPLQILSEFDAMKRAPNETVQDYYTKYNSVYNSIPTNLKPTPDYVLLKFPDRFHTDMAYQLRERNFETLERMHTDVVSVEVNILAKKARLRNERRVTIKEETSSSDGKIDQLAKNLERMMDRLDNI